MSDELERHLKRLTPRKAPPELRARVLAAMDAELATAAPRRRFPAATATAALLLLAAGLNFLATRENEDRLARAFGPRPIPRDVLDLARDVSEHASPEAGRRLLDRLAARPPRPTASTTEADLRRHADLLEHLARESTFEPRKDDDETVPQAIPQVDRDRRRPAPGRLLVMERGLYLDHRPSA
ncbi:hypothetical protein [Planctomyces sp. SH-PL62]|uniref:hypothetical protein n=1 Tax=Planctomyces sp. SH-PL62 TaxID=1636152 RepID=UPI0012E792D6|nr:hypothetical protein [Planctomyces sp. SH-PL62]